MNKIAFDPSIGKWVVFYTTDRTDFDFETGQALSPIMCNYHMVAECDTKEEAERYL
jgi:hypothetical protein